MGHRAHRTRGVPNRATEPATAGARLGPDGLVVAAARQLAGERIHRAEALEIYGVPPIVYPMDPSSGPVGAVCGVSSPPTPVASFGISYAGSNPHGPDENIRVDDFLQSIKFIGRVIHKLGETKTKTSGITRRDSGH